MFSLTGSFWGGPLKNWQGDQSTNCKSLFVPTLFLHPVNTMHCGRGGGGQLSRCQKPQIPLSWITAEPKNLWQHFSHFAWGQLQPSMTSSSAYHHLSPHCKEDQTCWNWSWLWRRASSCTSTRSALQQCSLKPSSEVSSCGRRNGGCCDGSWDLMKWSRGSCKRGQRNLRPCFRWVLVLTS